MNGNLSNFISLPLSFRPSFASGQLFPHHFTSCIHVTSKNFQQLYFYNASTTSSNFECSSGERNIRVSILRIFVYCANVRSISIACWVIVFAPQIYENFNRKSAEGLSLLFVVLWLIGDIFNVIGSILQNVLPTMLILAIYYTLADIVLLVQCLMYGTRLSVDPIHLSPANPLSEDVLDEILVHSEDLETHRLISGPKKQELSKLKTEFYNGILVSLVLIAGIGGWYISYVRAAKHDRETPPEHDHDNSHDLEVDFWGQVFGYLCAVFYLGSRIPQILLNYRRKSCEGISFMFFFFACMGNLTFVLSILCIGVSWRYIVINMSWLLGSVGTLGLDVVIFVQFFVYNGDDQYCDYESIDDQLADES